MGPHQHWEGQSHFLQPGGSSPPNAPQGSVSILCSLCCKGTSLAHVALAGLCFPARQSLLCGVSPPHVQDFALLVQLHEVSACLLLQPVKVHLDGSEKLWFISHCTQFQSLYLWIHLQVQSGWFFFFWWVGIFVGGFFVCLCCFGVFVVWGFFLHALLGWL